MKLVDALQIKRGDVVSFIGAGGKTSALLRLGRELKANGWRVLATTTTRVAAAEIADVPLAMRLGADPDLALVSSALSRHGFVFAYDRIEGNKAIGIRPEAVRQLLDRVGSDVLLVEADGSRRLPLKVPHPHEPALPQETTQIVLSAGLNALGRPLDNAHVYNADAMIQRYGYPEGAPLVWPWLASVLRDEQLGLRGVPPDYPVSVLLNQVPAQGIDLRRARLIASLLLRSTRVDSVLIGEMQAEGEPIHEVRRPVAAIVLAAGKSSRMGDLKVLLPWGRETVLDTIIRRLQMVRLDHILVVTGREAEKVEAIAHRLGVDAVFNPDYAQGEMLSSLKAGLLALDRRYAACLVVLGDQPQMQGRVIGEVLDAYAHGCGSIVAPSFQMRRGHPILIGREHWADMLALEAGQSPRDLINARADAIAYVNVNTDTILGDIDTPADYRAALREAGLS